MAAIVSCSQSNADVSIIESAEKWPGVGSVSIKLKQNKIETTILLDLLKFDQNKGMPIPELFIDDKSTAFGSREDELASSLVLKWFLLEANEMTGREIVDITLREGPKYFKLANVRSYLKNSCDYKSMILKIKSETCEKWKENFAPLS